MYPERYQELLDFLDSNPEYLQDLRIRLLTPDLVALPEQFAQLVNTVNELAAKVEQLTARFDELTNRFDQLTATVKELAAKLEELTATVKELAAKFESFAGETNRRLGTLESDVATLKSDVAALKGSDLERRARESILNIAKDELRLTRGRILITRGRDTAMDFRQSITRADENGLITEEEADHVLDADIIIRARRTADKQYVYAVFEVSRTIRQDDIERARDRAAAVAAATGEPALAAVIGEIIRPQQQALAEENSVQVLLPAMLRQRDREEDETDE